MAFFFFLVINHVSPAFIVLPRVNIINLGLEYIQQNIFIELLFSAGTILGAEDMTENNKKRSLTSRRDIIGVDAGEKQIIHK